MDKHETSAVSPITSANWEFPPNFPNERYRSTRPLPPSVSVFSNKHLKDSKSRFLEGARHPPLFVRPDARCEIEDGEFIS